jgi:hypothetical protein
MWYAASLFFKGTHSDAPDRESVWEEQIVLVEAGSDEEARARARELGRSFEHEYGTRKSDVKVRWELVEVERVCGIEGNGFQTGLEVFSRFISQEEALSLLEPFKD